MEHAIKLKKKRNDTRIMAGGWRPTLKVSTGPTAVGVYRFRFDDVGRLVAIRGTWMDPQTFVLEHNSVTANDQLVLQFHFQGDQVEVIVSDAYSGTGPKFLVTAVLTGGQPLDPILAILVALQILRFGCT